jgi:hypothetical protein
MRLSMAGVTVARSAIARTILPRRARRPRRFPLHSIALVRACLRARRSAGARAAQARPFA